MNLAGQIILSDSKIENLISQNNYAAAADHLFSSQQSSWELLKKNYDALKDVQIKSFWFDGFKINVQFNPERMKSTAAKVDEKSISNRKCFLCIDNLPEEQKGIILSDKFLLLCNPYPIFPKHFTISSLKHAPQRINENIESLLELTKQLAQGFTLVYNGPACGASAPDHLHFQVGTKLFMPIENDIQQMKNDYGIIIDEKDKVNISLINDGLRRLIFIESTDSSKIRSAFLKILSVYENLSVYSGEPMMNIISSYDEEIGWSLIIFIRSKHRPECFYREGSEKILLSPAAIDLGGVLVSPREEDFIKIDKTLLEIIFNEVSFEKEKFSLLADKLKDVLN